MASCNASVTIPWFQYFSPITYPYFGIEAFHICAWCKSDIAYGFSINFNTKIMNAFFFLDEVNKGFRML